MQVPVYQANQVIQASNPVPIQSPENTADGIRAQALGGFAKAAADLNNVIARELSNSEKERARLEAQAALGEASGQYLKIMAAERARAVQPDDSADGSSAIKRFEEAAVDVNNRLTQNMTPLAKMYFMSDVGQLTTRYSQDVLVQEIKKREEVIPELEGRIFNALGNEVRQEADNPEFKFVTNVGRAELTIRSSTIRSDADKVALLAATKRDYADQLVQGLIEKEQFDKGLEILDGKGEGSRIIQESFDAKGMASLRKRLLDAKSGYYADKLAEEDRRYKNEKRIKEQERDKELERFTRRLIDAGNNQQMIELIQQDISTSRALEPSDKALLFRSKEFAEADDDKYEAGIRNKIFMKNSPRKLLDEVNRDFKNGRVSADRRLKIISVLNNLDNANKQSPHLKALADAGFRQIQNAKLTSRSIAPGVTITETSQEVNAAAIQYKKEITQMLSSPNGLTTEGIMKAYERNMSNALGVPFTVGTSLAIPGAPRGSGTSKEDLTAQRAGVVKKLKEAQAKYGDKIPDSILTAIEANLNAIDQKEKGLRMEEAVKIEPVTPEGSDGVPAY